MKNYINKRPGLFLDRDGVINKDYGYVHRQDNFEFFYDIFEICRPFSDLSIPIIVVTNQSGIGRGLFSKEDFLDLTEWMVSEFRERQVKISKVFYSTTAPGQGFDYLRKPSPGMFLEAAREFNIDLARSVMIGDKESDMKAALTANIKHRILIGDPDLATSVATDSAMNHEGLYVIMNMILRQIFD